ncbi:DUF5050 domain-containing protein [Eubacteriales bacterium OttesenSCG-928-N14]|nr:DUF5050 domain-containing protein [Eubacteriales bacterium OttesenSCG-928-N14]
MKRMRFTTASLLCMAMILILSGCFSDGTGEGPIGTENPTELDRVEGVIPEGVTDYQELFEEDYQPVALPEGFYTPQGAGYLTFADSGIYYTGIGMTTIWQGNYGLGEAQMVKTPDETPKGAISMLCYDGQSLYYYVQNDGIYRLGTTASVKVVSGAISGYCIYDGAIYAVKADGENSLHRQEISGNGETELATSSGQITILGADSKGLYYSVADGDTTAYYLATGAESKSSSEQAAKTALKAYQPWGAQDILPLSEYRYGFSIITGSSGEGHDENPNLIRRRKEDGINEDVCYVMGTTLYVAPYVDAQGAYAGMRLYATHVDGRRIDYIDMEKVFYDNGGDDLDPDD